MEKENSIVDVVIIGGGPVGLFAAFNCGMRGMSVKVLEAGNALGGKVARFYPEKYIYDIGGMPAVSGKELVDNMITQAGRHQPEILMECVVTQVEKVEGGIFCLTTNSGKHYSKAVIACTGMGRYEPVLLDIENAAEFESESLHYMFNKPEKFDGAKVAIYTDHRAGIDWALALEGKAEQVYVINNKEKFAGAAEGDLDKLAASSAEVFYNTSIQALKGEGNQLASVSLSGDGGMVKELQTSQLLAYLGVKFSGVPLDEWGIKNEKSRMVVNASMAANMEGFYAAGDAAYYPGKSLLIANGYTEAITAVNSAAVYLDKSAPAQVYSTVIYRNK